MLAKRFPVWRRARVWGVAQFKCERGPAGEDDGPFAGEDDGGCGFTRDVYLGMGVGGGVNDRQGGAAIPGEAGECERCGGPMSYTGIIFFLDFNEKDLPEDAFYLRLPSRRPAGRMMHEGKLEAVLVEPGSPIPLDV